MIAYRAQTAMAIALPETLARADDARPLLREIVTTDQGSQFTSEAFTGRLERQGIRISMDGRGRVFDNVFIERLWRTVQYEEVYLNEYDGVWMADDRLGRYFDFYNHDRLHQALDYRTPAELYFGGEKPNGLELRSTLKS